MKLHDIELSDDWQPRFDAVLRNLMRPRTGKPQLREVRCIDKLKEEICHPARDEQILPLVMGFKGHHNLRRWRQLWNYANAMFLAECETMSEGTKMYRESSVGHLCGMHSAGIERMRLQSFFSRLSATPKVCAVVPGLHEYVRHVMPYAFNLQRVGVGLGTAQKRRKDVLKHLDREFGKSGERQYPFNRGSLDMEDQLLGAIHAAVPSRVPRTIRADLCQDLAVAVLCGDIKIENVPDALKSYLREASKFKPHQEEEFFRHGLFGGTNKRADHKMGWQEQIVSCDDECGHEPADPIEEPELDELERRFHDKGWSIRTTNKAAPVSVPENFLPILKAEYPRRQGDNGWGQIPALIQKALRAGADWSRILAGTKAYRAHCDQTDKTGTEFVKQARTFYGVGQWWEEWADADIRSPAEITADRRWSDLQQRGGAVGVIINRAARFEMEQDRVNRAEQEALDRRFEQAGMNRPKFSVVK